MKEDQHLRKKKILIEWQKRIKHLLIIDGKNILNMKSKKLKMIFFFSSLSVNLQNLLKFQKN